MKKQAIVEVFSEEVNFAVIRIPERQYPGVLVQGDSLYNLLSTVIDVIEVFENDKEEAMEALKFLYKELNWRVENYQKVMEDNNSPFPFAREKPFQPE